jgi:RNA polymerase sigma-70 factor (ECF subfamily)
MAPSDEVLLAQYKQGDPRAFRMLVDRYTAPLYNLALRLTRDSMEAENIAQETFLRVITVLDRVRLDAPFKPYLFRIAVNLCRDIARKKQPLLFADLNGAARDDKLEDASEAIADDAPPLWERLEEEELHARLHVAMDNLPPNYQTVIMLRYVEGFSYEEIAQALDLPLNTVRTHLRRAKQQLRATLEKDTLLASEVLRMLPAQGLGTE